MTEDEQSREAPHVAGADGAQEAYGPSRPVRRPAAGEPEKKPFRPRVPGGRSRPDRAEPASGEEGAPKRPFRPVVPGGASRPSRRATPAATPPPGEAKRPFRPVVPGGASRPSRPPAPPAPPAPSTAVPAPPAPSAPAPVVPPAAVVPAAPPTPEPPAAPTFSVHRAHRAPRVRPSEPEEPAAPPAPPAPAPPAPAASAVPSPALAAPGSPAPASASSPVEPEPVAPAEAYPAQVAAAPVAAPPSPPRAHRAPPAPPRTPPGDPRRPSRPPGPHDGKRLSPWRVLLGLLIVVALGVGGVLAYRGYVFAESRPELAEPWFAGYVDVTATPSYAFESPTNAAGRDVVLSFVVAQAAESCVPTWGTAYTLDQAGTRLDLDRRIARLREQQGEVVVSFGGSSNTELATACSDPGQLVDAYRSVVDRYGVTTIDLDIEKDDLVDVEAGQRRALAVATVQRERRAAGHPLSVWLTLPVSPTGLTDDGMRVLRGLVASGVDVAGVNAMTMDYGTDLGGRSMAAVAEAALTGVQGQVAQAFAEAQASLTDREAWSKVAATPMIGQNDVVSEVFTIDDARALNAFAATKGLGRLSMWSLNRDRACGPNYGDQRTVSDSCSGVEQRGTTFAETLAPGFGGRIGQAPVSATPTPRASIVDDPATSPYPVWDVTATYLAGSKVVWHGNVYVAKYWNRGSLPDDPVATAGDTPWTIVGPVLPGETPHRLPAIPDGLLPTWSGTAIYDVGSRVVFDGAAYEAKWWTRGDSPAAATADPAGSPWVALSAADVDRLVAGG